MQYNNKKQEYNTITENIHDTNCEREVKNSQNLYAVGLGNMALRQLAMYYV